MAFLGAIVRRSVAGLSESSSFACTQALDSVRADLAAQRVGREWHPRRRILADPVVRPAPRSLTLAHFPAKGAFYQVHPFEHHEPFGGSNREHMRNSRHLCIKSAFTIPRRSGEERGKCLNAAQNTTFDHVGKVVWDRRFGNRLHGDALTTLDRHAYDPGNNPSPAGHTSACPISQEPRMNLDINNMAYKINQERFDRRVVRDYESLPRTKQHHLRLRIGGAISRFGHRLQGVPAPSGTEFQPCPDPTIA
jgi:hypothetical protein